MQSDSDLIFMPMSRRMPTGMIVYPQQLLHGRALVWSYDTR
jgi:hypothetical protein